MEQQIAFSLSLPLPPPTFFLSTINKLKIINKVIWRGKIPQKNLHNTGGQEPRGRADTPNFMTLCETTVIRKGGTGESVDRWTNGTEQTAKKQTHTNTVNSSLTKKQRQHSGERRVFSTIGTWTTGHPHAPGRGRTQTSQYSYESPTK